jgi:hypothetical protein
MVELLHLFAENGLVDLRCKHNYLGERKADYCVNWGAVGGL